MTSTWPIALGAQERSTGEPDPFQGVEEMIVVGTGTAALLAPQSTSAIAFDSSELESYGVEDLSDIAAYVPNLEIRSQNATNASFFIRGVGLQDFGSNASSAVPIFQDGIARNPSATQLVGLYDVGGLNVLRGPQGSGNYRNASAGAILIETAKPEPEFSGYAQMTVASIVSPDARDAARYDAEAAVSAPIWADWISVRLSTRYSHEKPFVENDCANRVGLDQRIAATRRNDPDAQLCDTLLLPNGEGNGEQLTAPFGPQPGAVSQVRPFLPRYIGEVDDWGFRGQIRFQPPDTGMDWILRVGLSNLNRDSTVGQHIGTGGANGDNLGVTDNYTYRDPDIELRFRQLRDGGLSVVQANERLKRELTKRPLDRGPYRGGFDSPGRTLLETYSVSLSGLIDLEPMDIDVNVGWLDYNKSEDRDTDLSPNVKFPSKGDDQAWEIYGDLKLSGDFLARTPVQWETGLYTLVEKVEANQVQTIAEALRDNEFTQEIYSWGVFASFRYEFLESFTLAAGARYNWERKDFRVKDLNTRFFLGNVITFPPQKSSNQLTWDAFTGFAEIRYDFTEDVSSYMKYTRGFKAGHFNPSRPDKAEVPDEGFADPEKIDAFEWGVDFSFWAERVRGNTAVFYYNYENYQVFRLATTAAGVFRVIQNAEKARNYGAELELTVTPLEGFAPPEIEGLRINLRGGWLEAEFIDYTEIDTRTFGAFPATVLIDYTGNPLLNSANLQLSGTFTWPIVLERLGTLTPQYDFTWTDDTPFDANQGRGQIDGFGQSKFSPYLIGNRAYILHNVRLSYEPPGAPTFRISGWCRNLTDERYRTFAVDISNFAKQQLHYVADPRTCGADIRFQW